MNFYFFFLAAAKVLWNVIICVIRHEHAITGMYLFLITLQKVNLGHEGPHSVETWNDIKLYVADHDSCLAQGLRCHTHRIAASSFDLRAM
jgi:hypothetical protein